MANEEQKKDKSAGRFRRKVDWKKTDHIITDRTKGSNDPKWYFKGNETLAKDVAQLSYNTRLGQEVDDQIFQSAIIASKFDTAGIMTLNWQPCLGLNEMASDNLSQAQFGYYSNVRSTNSGAGNYESSDMMAYTISLANLYAAYFYMRRIYGVANLAAMRNNYIGSRSILVSMGINPESIQRNLANIRSDINIFATKLSNFALPNNLDLVRRWCFMSDNIYADSSDVGKAQLYIYNMAAIFKYNWSREGGSALDLISTGAGRTSLSGVKSKIILANWNEIYGTFNQCLAALSDNTDVSIISGDILKRYGDNEIFGVSTIPEDYTVFPIYDEEVLEQIHNADIPYVKNTDVIYNEGGGSSPFLSRNDIYQDSNILISKPILWKSSALPKRKCILNSRFRTPTVEDNFVNTRLKYTVSETRDSGETDYIEEVIASCGSELISSAYILAQPYSDNNTETLRVYPVGYSMPIDVVALTMGLNEQALDTANSIAYIQQFDWHPLYRIELGYAGDSGLPNVIATQVAGDLANFVIVEDTTLTNINYCALLSLFNVLPDTTRIL